MRGVGLSRKSTQIFSLFACFSSSFLLGLLIMEVYKVAQAHMRIVLGLYVPHPMADLP